MAIRSIKVRLPPSTGDPNIDMWMRDVTNAINSLPVSVFSTSDGPNTSGVTAPVGFIGIEVGSNTSRFWLKRNSSNTTGWDEMDYV